MKRFVDKILDVPKLILTIWIMLWAMLIILLVMKFCFGMWYPIVVENESFMNVCNFVDENKWLYLIIMGILYEINTIFMFFICCNYRKFPNIISIVIILVIGLTIYTLKNLNNIVGMLLEIFMIGCFIFYNIKFKRFNNIKVNIILPIVVYILLNLWQFTMLIIRGTSQLVLTDLPSLIILILQIDYYIFLIISWIGVSFMGIAGWGWFWSKDITVLKTEKEKELAKAKPNMKKIESLDIRIAELEKEGK